MPKHKYEPGALIFGKVKGYPPWPARITGLGSKDRYKIYFYGTYETATLRSEDIWPYNPETKEKFAPKNMKKKGYPEGIDQIENTPEIAPVEGDIDMDTTAEVEATSRGGGVGGGGRGCALGQWLGCRSCETSWLPGGGRRTA